MAETSGFPPGFLFGAATSAYQIEGSPLADGAGPNIWHDFSHTPGKVANGDTGDVACDHYRRFAADVDLMAQLGLAAYRFSVAWARVLPAGRGAVNQAGLGFYDRLTDRLLARGIRPVLTLYHWDLPSVLDAAGGWLNRDVAFWFADYARVVARALGDRVALWATLNEPWVVSDAGYLHRVHPPGRGNAADAAVASRNLLRAHGAALQAIRAEAKSPAGLVVNLEPKPAASDTPQDQEAAQRADAYMNRQFLDPIFFGRFPEELREAFGPPWGDLTPDDVTLIRQPLDFLGVNYYTRGVTRYDAATPLRAERVRQPQHVYTETDWEVYAPALTDVLLWVRQRYGSVPLYVTENGAAFDDPPPTGTVIEDPPRVSYLRDHLLAVRRALAAGADVRGYFVWSLLDNFEWQNGYAKRFGLVHVDPSTQRRTLKASARFYADVIRTHGSVLADHVLGSDHQ